MPPLVRLLRDLLHLRDGAGCALFDATASGAPAAGGDVRYHALDCRLDALDPTCDEFARVLAQLRPSFITGGGHAAVVVDAIYIARRAPEAHAFREDLPNQRLLMHATRAENVVGILSRSVDGAACPCAGAAHPRKPAPSASD